MNLINLKNGINEILYISCLLVYTYSIVMIIVSQSFNAFVGRIIFVISCFPTTFALTCTMHSFACGFSCLLCVSIIKYIILFICETIPTDFYFFIAIDCFLQCFFILSAYGKERSLIIKKKVIPIITNVYEVSELVCSICLDTLNEQIVETICKHQFHEKCLEEWNKTNFNCPLCRNDLKENE